MQNIEVGAFKMAESYKSPLSIIAQLPSLYYLFISYNRKLHSL